MKGADNYKSEHTVALGPGAQCTGSAFSWTLYPGPVLNVRDQHSQSGFHGVPQELVCLPLPGRGKRKECVSGSKAGARRYTVHSA